MKHDGRNRQHRRDEARRRRARAARRAARVMYSSARTSRKQVRKLAELAPGEPISSLRRMPKRRTR